MSEPVRPRVLLVEDNREIRRKLRETLEWTLAGGRP